MTQPFLPISDVPNAAFRSALRGDVIPACTSLAGVGLLTAMLSHLYAPPPGRLPMLTVALVCYIILGLAYLGERWREGLARWTLTGACAAFLPWVVWFAEIPGWQALLPLPIVLAGLLLGTRGAAVITLLEGAIILAIIQALPVHALELIYVLVALVATLLMLIAHQRPTWNLVEWSWRNYGRLQNLLDEARDRSLELERVLAELLHANRQLDLLNERLAAARLAAEEAHNAKAAFVAKVSHEFRTPLNMIIGLTDLVIETPHIYDHEIPPALMADLRIVHRNCTHLAGMINDVLDISQTEAGRLSLRREWAAVEREIEAAIEVVRPLIEKKGLWLRTYIQPDIPLVYCDRTRIRQVILNLVSNAARYTHRGGIAVEAVQYQEHLVVSVADSGPGIPRHELEQIFEPFHQIAKPGMYNETAQKGGEPIGSGLGLTISKQFIELHGGKIWAESEEGQGSKFKFRLRFAPSAAPQARAGRWINEDWMWLERINRPPLPESPYTRRFLIYDEATELLPVLSQLDNTVEWVSAPSIDAVIDEYRKTPAHALVVNTPEPERLWALVDYVRRELTDLPVLGYSTPRTLASNREAKVLDYLIKPVTRADLRGVLNTCPLTPRLVLLVDDNADFRSLLQRMLLAIQPDLEFITAESVQDAVNRTKEQSPDLIFLDITLPHQDGWEFLDYLAHNDETRQIPVSIISAQDPDAHPAASGLLVTALGDGLSMLKLHRATLALSYILLSTDSELDPAPQ